MAVGGVGEPSAYSIAAYGHCAYYDTPYRTGIGTQVVDVSDPKNPHVTEQLTTPAMRYPHEGLKVNPARGLLGAMSAGAQSFDDAYASPYMDLYDVTGDCAHPKLLGSNLVPGASGHEGDFSPDGKTFWASGTSPSGVSAVSAVDIQDPAAPKLLYKNPLEVKGHGLSLRPDGNRLYIAAGDATQTAGPLGAAAGPFNGVQIWDVSDIQARKANPQARMISKLFWSDGSAAQIPVYFTRNGKPYLLHTDEFGSCGFAVGLAGGGGDGCIGGHARIIDISDERNPKVISQIVLQAHLDGADAFHYCTPDSLVDPTVVGCSAWQGTQGVRIFDIRDVTQPREIAYYSEPSNAPAGAVWFFPEQRLIYFNDMNNAGFNAARFTHGVWPFPESSNFELPPAPRKCAARRIRIKLFDPRGKDRFRSVSVRIDGKVVNRLKGRRLRRALRRGSIRVTLPTSGNRARVTVAASTSRGKTVRRTRIYRTCA